MFSCRHLKQNVTVITVSLQCIYDSRQFRMCYSLTSQLLRREPGIKTPAACGGNHTSVFPGEKAGRSVSRCTCFSFTSNVRRGTFRNTHQNSTMLHVRARPSSIMFHFNPFYILVFHTAVILALVHSCKGQPGASGPLQPVMALIGDDIILPCKLNPVMDAFDMTVEWARPDLEPRFVLVWRDGVELVSKKHMSYDRRTSLFNDELKNGNISLKLSKVKLSDEGTYRCYVPQLDRSATVQLVVGAASSPIAKINRTISTVVLQCESAGWYPQPELFWLDGEGNLLSGEHTEILRGPDGLYNVSSAVTVEKRHSNNFTCRVQQKNSTQSRETHIRVPEDFFMVISPSSPTTASNPNIITGLIIGAAVLFLILGVFIVWKWRRGKFKKKKSEEDGCEQIRKDKVSVSKTDDTEVHVVVEGGESELLLTGRQEENDVASRGEESHKYEREKQDNHLTTAELTSDAYRTEGEGMIQFVISEKVTKFTTEQETHKNEDMTGRRVKEKWSEIGGERIIETGKEDSGLQISPSTEGHKEHPVLDPLNLLTDQKSEREKETQQEQLVEEKSIESDLDKKQPNMKKKKKNKQEKMEKRSSRSTAKKKQQIERVEAEQQLEENQRKLQLETRTEREKDELKTQKDKDNQLCLESNKEERSEAEPEDGKDKDQEEHQRDSEGMTERKTEEQRDQKEKTIPSVFRKVTEKIELKIKQNTSRGENQENKTEEKTQSTQEIKEQPVLAKEEKSFNTMLDWSTDQKPEREKETQGEQIMGHQVRKKEGDMEKKTENIKKEKVRKKNGQRGQLKAQQQGNQRKRPSESRTEREKDETELQAQKDTDNQLCLERNKQERSEAESEHEKENGQGGNQRDNMGMKDRKAEEEKGQKENTMSSVSSKITERTDPKTQTRGKKQENQQTQKIHEEIREQQEKLRGAASGGGAQGEVLESDEECSTTETHRKDTQRGKLQLGQKRCLQAEKQLDVNQRTIREQQEESVSPTESGFYCQDEEIEEVMEDDEKSDADQQTIKRKKHDPERELHKIKHLTVRKRKNQKEGRAKIQKNLKEVNKGRKREKNSQMDIDDATTSQHAATAKLSQDI